MQLDDPPVRTDEVREYPVSVAVKGRTSNALTLQVRGQVQAGTPVITAVFPPQAPRGGLVALEGTFPGSVGTRTFMVGGQAATAEGEDGWHRPMVRIPATAPLGVVEITAADGLGSPPSAPATLEVWADEPPVLAAGAGAAGVVASPWSNGWMEAVRLVFAASGWESHDRFADGPHKGALQQKTRFEISTPRGATEVSTAWCGFQPEGRCALAAPADLFAGLEAGDVVTVTAHVPESVLGAGGTLQTTERVSAPLDLVVATDALPGRLHWVQAYADGFRDRGQDAGTPLKRLFLARGEALCLAAPGTAEGAAERFSAPGLWDGEVVASFGNFSSAPLGEPGVDPCMPLPAAGTFTVTALDRGVSLQVEVRRDGGVGGSEVSLPSNLDLMVAAGGAVLTVPAGALRGGPYQRAFFNAWRTEDRSATAPHWDPAVDAGGTRWQIQLRSACVDSPGNFCDPPGLDRPVVLELPYDPARGKAPPEVEFYGPDGTGWRPPVEVDASAGTITYTFPAGTYEVPVEGAAQLVRQWPRAAPPPSADAFPPPMDLSHLTREIGVSYHVLEEGVLEDTDGWFRLEYVTDPASADFCTEDYAREVLQYLTAAYRFLKNQGWLEPQRHDLVVTTRVRLRHSVSFWDFAAEALAATGSGWFGSPEIAVRSNLPRDNTFRTALAHEVGHLFQRQYTVNATLSWLDEGAAEWAAFRTLGAEYAWDPDKAAVAIPVLGFPTWFWGGYPRAQMYGTSSLLIWLADTFGDAAVLSLYENLVVTAAYWQDPRGLFSLVSGQDLRQLNDAFGKAFWRQSYAPVDARTSLQEELDTFLWPGRTSTATVVDEKGATLPWNAAPLSSVRFRVSLPSTATAPLADGDMVVRAAGPATWPWEVLVFLDTATASAKPPAGSGTSLVPGIQTALKVSAPFPSYLWAILLNNWTDAADLSLRVAFPRLKSVAPASARAGDTLTITGHDFGAAQGTVRVGGVTAAVTSWSDGGVTVTMPYLASTSSAEVRVVTAENARTNGQMITVLQ